MSTADRQTVDPAKWWEAVNRLREFAETEIPREQILPLAFLVYEVNYFGLKNQMRPEDRNILKFAYRDPERVNDLQLAIVLTNVWRLWQQRWLVTTTTVREFTVDTKIEIPDETRPGNESRA
jgi:hypothetical protein